VSTSAAAVLSVLPAGLSTALISEYNSIVRNFSEERWTPAELSGGKFCEIVYTILDGHTKGSYPASPEKPKNFVDACRKLETATNVPRSFQILIPRLLPPLYEIRNNRNVGHVGGDVNPSFMDATAVLSMASWIMAELVRVLHSVATHEAQTLVNSLVDRHIPLVWESAGGVKRVLNPALSLRDQTLILIASSAGKVRVADLITWTEVKNLTYFRKLLKTLHASRLAELDKNGVEVELLPSGSKEASRIVASQISRTP
jgi:hypothetical protein